jgi:hypothetical protein
LNHVEDQLVQPVGLILDAVDEREVVFGVVDGPWPR